VFHKGERICVNASTPLAEILHNNPELFHREQ
jgi:hypothetical protein